MFFIEKIQIISENKFKVTYEENFLYKTDLKTELFELSKSNNKYFLINNTTNNKTEISQGEYFELLKSLKSGQIPQYSILYTLEKDRKSFKRLLLNKKSFVAHYPILDFEEMNVIEKQFENIHLEAKETMIKEFVELITNSKQISKKNKPEYIQKVKKTIQETTIQLTLGENTGNSANPNLNKIITSLSKEEIQFFSQNGSDIFKDNSDMFKKYKSVVLHELSHVALIDLNKKVLQEDFAVMIQNKHGEEFEEEYNDYSMFDLKKRTSKKRFKNKTNLQNSYLSDEVLWGEDLTKNQLLTPDEESIIDSIGEKIIVENLQTHLTPKRLNTKKIGSEYAAVFLSQDSTIQEVFDKSFSNNYNYFLGNELLYCDIEFIDKIILNDDLNEKEKQKLIGKYIYLSNPAEYLETYLFKYLENKNSIKSTYISQTLENIAEEEAQKWTNMFLQLPDDLNDKQKTFLSFITHKPEDLFLMFKHLSNQSTIENLIIVLFEKLRPNIKNKSFNIFKRSLKIVLGDKIKYNNNLNEILKEKYVNNEIEKLLEYLDKTSLKFEEFSKKDNKHSDYFNNLLLSTKDCINKLSINRDFSEPFYILRGSELLLVNLSDEEEENLFKNKLLNINTLERKFNPKRYIITKDRLNIEDNLRKANIQNITDLNLPNSRNRLVKNNENNENNEIIILKNRNSDSKTYLKKVSKDKYIPYPKNNSIELELIITDAQKQQIKDNLKKGIHKYVIKMNKGDKKNISYEVFVDSIVDYNDSYFNKSSVDLNSKIIKKPE